jgi:hypothetical protein
MTKKTAQTVKPVAQPAAPLTRTRVIENFRQAVERSVEANTNTVRNIVLEKQASLAKGLGDQPEGIADVYEINHMYWGLQDLYEATGRLAVWQYFAQRVGSYFDVTPESLVVLTYEEKLAAVRRLNVERSLEDATRSENSTNPFSNAVTAAMGLGRGRVYRDIDQLCERILERLAIAVD